MKSARVSLVLEPSLRDKIDEYRRQQEDLPSRSEAIRRLVEQALESE